MTNQQPLNHKFNYKTTAMEVIKGINLSGKTAIVTGGYSGVGLETVKALSKARATIIVPARRIDVAKAATAGLEHIQVGRLDLMNQKSIHEFAEKFLATEQPLHILVNSAGIMYPPLNRDARGIESQFATNHLGHFQLTLELLPALKKAHSARVINVSSRAQRDNGILWDDWNFEKTEYKPKAAYSQSKSANILFTYELDRLVKKYNIRSFAVHPGMIPTTGIGRHMNLNVPQLAKSDAFMSMRNFFAGVKAGFNREKYDYYKNAKQGAATQTWAASSPELSNLGGLFLEDVNIGMAVPAYSTSRFGVRPWAIDPEQATRLWKMSEELTGVHFEESPQ